MTKFFTPLVLFFFLLNAPGTFGQTGPAIRWQKCLGGSGEDRAKDILINADGSFIVAGYSKSNDGDISGHHGNLTTSDALIAKLDPSGNLVWQRSVGGTNNDYFTTIIATTDNAYLCVGFTNSVDGDITNGHGDYDAWAVKINSAGTIVWSKCYGGSKKDVAADVTLTPDGGYAIMGTSYSVDGDVLSGDILRTDADGWAFKLNSSGTLLWEKCIGTGEDVGYNIIQSEDNNLYGIVSSSEEYIYNPGPEQQIKIRTPGHFYHINNLSGITNALFTIGGDSAFSVCKTADSIYISFTDLDYVYPLNCDKFYMNLGACTNSGTNFSTVVGPYVESCDFSALYKRFAALHGIASDNNKIIAAGKAENLSYGTPAWGNDTSNALIATKPFRNSSYEFYANYKEYGGQGDDGFNSIKVFPAGQDYVAAGFSTSIDGDVSGNHGGYDCWIVRLEGQNIITGNVFLDANNNGIRDAGELPFNNDIIKSAKPGFQQSALPFNGIYSNPADTGTYTTTLLLNRPYYSFTPASKTSVFTSYKNTDTANFAVHAIPGIQDYSISIASVLPPRPGFNLQYNIIYSNNGTTTLSNKNITFVKDSRTTLLGSVPAYTSVSGDTIRWNIANLLPVTAGSIELNLELSSIPVVNLGDVITASGLIDSIGDFHAVDNYAQVNQQAMGSYDPNDKQENFGGEIYPVDITAGRYLNYTIRFQNTGNDTAFNIIVRDTLDSKLRADSIEIVAASHPYTVNIKDNKYLAVVFNNIKLADSVHNESLSHGYFSYRIKPLSTLVIADTIKNSASIYFDFNPPVKTNTQITIVRPVPVDATWTGAVSTAWENTGNWSNHAIPDENTNVTINAGVPRYPVINSNAMCKSIQAKAGTNVLVKTGFVFKVLH